MSSKLKVAGWMAVGALTGVLATLQLRANARSSLSALPLEQIQQLVAVFDQIKRRYVEPVDEKKLITDAISGMVSGLDPHSQYFEKQALKEFIEGTSGKFVGLGIEVGMEDGLVKVISPIEDSPAFKAGLKSGDLIVRIDETAVRGLTLDQAVKRMRGDPDTKVNLSIYRKNESRSFPVTIIRKEILTKSVKAKVIEPGYAWLRISQFQERTLDDFVARVEDLYRQEPNLKGLVFDMRYDPGGLLDRAIGVAAAFLPPDVEVVSTKGQMVEAAQSFRAVPRDYRRSPSNDPLRRLPAGFKSLPLVVLVNEGSASASEIVAGALQDHHRAIVMGAQTFGKASVQTPICLANEGVPLDKCPSPVLKITTARYYTPKGNSIQAKGITPDVLLDETAEGNVFAALRTREADLEKHLAGEAEGGKDDAARIKAREEARAKLEAEMAKRNEPPKPLPEFGSAEDFPLQQALNQLKGLPVVASKASSPDKAEAKTQ